MREVIRIQPTLDRSLILDGAAGGRAKFLLDVTLRVSVLPVVPLSLAARAR